jgi:hypothetical protein
MLLTSRLVAKELAKYHCDNTQKVASKYNIGKGINPHEMIGMVLPAWPIPIQNQELHDE